MERNCLATQRRDRLRRGREVGRIPDEVKRRAGNMARDVTVPLSEKFVDFLVLYRPRDRVRCQLI